MVQDHATMVPETEGSLAPVLSLARLEVVSLYPAAYTLTWCKLFFFFSIFFVVVLCVCIVPFSALACYTNCPVFFCFSFVSAPSIDVCKKVLKKESHDIDGCSLCCRKHRVAANALELRVNENFSSHPGRKSGFYIYSVVFFVKQHEG